MKLQVRIVETDRAIGGRALMLCTEDGEPLPGQRRIITSGTTIEIEFVIDGNAISFGGPELEFMAKRGAPDEPRD